MPENEEEEEEENWARMQLVYNASSKAEIDNWKNLSKAKVTDVKHMSQNGLF